MSLIFDFNPLPFRDEPEGSVLDRQFKHGAAGGGIAGPGDPPSEPAPEPESLVVHAAVFTGML